MKKAINYVLGGIMIICVCACQKSMDGKKYASYVLSEKNGLKKTVHIGDWQYDMQYRPYDYIMYTECKGDKNYDWDARKKNLRGTAWFNISFRRKQGEKSPLKYNVASIEEYDQRLNYFLNYASKDIELVYGNDTLRPMSYLFETNYNLTPQETMIIGFELPGKPEKPEKDMQLVYYDQVFKNGIIKAAYSAEILNNIPKLNK